MGLIVRDKCFKKLAKDSSKKYEVADAISNVKSEVKIVTNEIQ